jgi:hypothetical protein
MIANKHILRPKSGCFRKEKKNCYPVRLIEFIPVEATDTMFDFTSGIHLNSLAILSSRSYPDSGFSMNSDPDAGFFLIIKKERGKISFKLFKKLLLFVELHCAAALVR